jgi:hypothetical protein
MLLGAGLFAALSGLALLAARREVRTADWLAWLAFLYLALAARRNLAFFGIVAAPMAVRYANLALDARVGRASEMRRAVASVVVAGAILLIAFDVYSGAFHRRLGIPREPGLGVMETFYAFGAMDWIRAHAPSPPIAHTMPDGDLMIWALHPDYRVMVDGRLEVYGPALLERLRLRTPAELRALHADYHFGAVLLHYSKLPSEALLRALVRDPAWKLVFLDEVSALFVASDSPAGRRAPEIDAAAKGVFPPRIDAGRTQTELRARGRALFYAATGQPRRARAEMAWASARYPGIVWRTEAD